MPKILISACLLGQKVRYDGKDCLQNHKQLKAWIKNGDVISICPEMAGGLPTPRPPSEIERSGTSERVLKKQSRVLSNKGEDVTDHYILGAQKALHLAQANNIKVAILKARSPSCGSAQIYDGTFSKTLIAGMGVTAELLTQHGIKVFDEYHIDEALDAAIKNGER